MRSELGNVHKQLVFGESILIDEFAFMGNIQRDGNGKLINTGSGGPVFA